ncbi:MAG: DUF1700 domain-containing protein [Lachnospiraceae bacterium]|nr:DUF1700 domain-containing protein [Lachnospiraceae bacterium]
MNKQEFMQKLEHYLRHLTDDDAQDALEYYSEYIDDLGLAPDEDVCARIGTPREVSRQIIAQTTERKISEQTEKNTVRGSGSILWLTILGICASPIALPISIALVVIVIALIITIGSILLSFFVAGCAMVLAGIALALLSIISGSVGQVFVCVGCGIFIIGLGILFVMGSAKLTSLTVHGLSAMLNKAIAKRRQKKEDLQ